MLSIRRTTRGPLPRIDFEAIARRILGSRYELSLVVCGDQLSRRMNREHRGRSYIPNVLSFPITAGEGEIFLNPRVAAQEARRYGVSYNARTALLFAHGCLHLKGMRHGPKMEAIEARIAKKYGKA